MKKFLGLLCVIALTIMVTACGKSTIVGKYSLVEMTNEGQTVSADTLKSLGMTFELEVKADNTATLSVYGESISLTYNDKVFTGIDEETKEEKSIPYTLEGNKITLESDGEKMVFKK